VDPAALSDAELIEAVVGWDRLASWAQARQARLLAEFARRRPPDPWQARRSDRPSRCSEFAPDEVGLALRLSRTAAANRLAVAEALVHDLPVTLATWEAGHLDGPKMRAICEAADLLEAGLRAALEARVLPRAPRQTSAQLRRSLLRAVVAIDPAGAQRRHRERRRDRRVVVSPDSEGMSTRWALLPAPDAVASDEWLGRLARSLGADDPRGMDARRADLLVELLTGRRCAAGDGCRGDGCRGDGGSAASAPTSRASRVLKSGTWVTWRPSRPGIRWEMTETVWASVSVPVRCAPTRSAPTRYPIDGSNSEASSAATNRSVSPSRCRISSPGPIGT